MSDNDQDPSIISRKSLEIKKIAEILEETQRTCQESIESLGNMKKSL